jgi:hypothetical protein
MKKYLFYNSELKRDTKILATSKEDAIVLYSRLRGVAIEKANEDFMFEVSQK